MEHFYNAPHMGEDYFTYAALYKAAVENFPSGSHFVEIGAYKGRSSSYLAVEIVNSGKNIKLDCIDSWDNEDFKRYWNSQEEGLGDGVYKNFVRNISPVRDRINVIKGNSWETANLYKDNSLDFVFIDADHEYDSVYKDINAWLPKVKRVDYYLVMITILTVRIGSVCVMHVIKFSVKEITQTLGAVSVGLNTCKCNHYE